MLMMSGWHSLQGYLGYRPSGALGRFKAKKKQWFVFDERHCLLLFYKNELDASTKAPLGHVELRAAAISLNMENPNQFLIHSQGKEHIFTAETHESTMIWLLALQAKRDSFNNKSTIIVDQRTVEFKEREELKRKESLPSDQEIQQMIRRAMCAENGGGGGSLFGGLLRSQSVREQNSSSSGSSSVSPLSHNFRKKVLHHSLRQSVDLGSIKTGSGLDLSVLFQHRSRTCSGGSIATTDSEDTDTSFGGRVPTASPSVSPRLAHDECRSLDSPALLHSLLSTLEEPVRRIPSPVQNFDTTLHEDEDEILDSDRATLSDNEQLKVLQEDLLTSQLELTKALNREEVLMGVLESKDATIQHLESRIVDNRDKKILMEDTNCSSPSLGSQRLEEKCRIIQNQNRFLNEEILKLSRMWQQEQMKFSQQIQKVYELETEMDRLKRDYVFLLQSSIRIAGGDGPDFIEVPIYGGSRHKERVTKLLEEARKSNPSLPSFEGMAKSGCHVDAFGFKHCYINEGLMLHYLCGQLNQHYNEQLTSSEQNQKRWKEILKYSACNSMPRTKELKQLVRFGIPNNLRAKVWGILIQEKVSDIKECKGQLYYNHLCSVISDSEAVTNNRRQISLDLFRTMPSNVHFNETEADGIKKMQEVLQAFCIHNPAVGYCQGMNFIVGMALLFMKPDDAFWFLVAVTERYFPPYYFDQNLMGAQADQEVLRDILGLKLPALANHLNTLDIELSTITLNWFLAVFFESVPFDTLLRIWDCFLFEGPKVLFRFSLAIFKMNESSLLEGNNTISIMRLLKASSKLCYDVEGLMRTAFDDLKPFPRRAEIISRQTCYLKTLKEKYRKRGMEKDAFENKEKLLEGLNFNTNDFSIECAAIYGENLLICESEQQEGRVMKVCCSDGTRKWLNIQFDSRIMCTHVMTEANLLIFGTLSHCVYVYQSSTIHAMSELAWQATLNDAVLSICSQVERNKGRLYAAMADGTVAVLEWPIGTNCNGNEALLDLDVFYIMIGSGPVTCLAVVERRLWCACGNRIVILHAKTLDTIDQFTVSTNPLDIVASITESRYGVWIVLRGLTIFQLWDPQNLVCRMLFDTVDNKCSRMAQEGAFGTLSRVTCILPLEESLWVGTGDGHLLIYDIQLLPSCRASAFSSPCQPGPVDVTSMDLVTERIQELYLQQSRPLRNELVPEFIDKSASFPRGRSDSGYQTVGDGSKESSVVHCSRASGKECTGLEDGDLSRRLETVTAGSDISDTDDASQTVDVCSSTTTTVRGSSNASVTSPTPAADNDDAACDCGPFSRQEEMAGISQKTEKIHYRVVPGRRNKNNPSGWNSDDVLSRCRCVKLKVTGWPNGRSRRRRSRSALEASLQPSRRSFDDVTHLLAGSGESFGSFPTCGSFEFDDVFVTHTEDERWWNRKSSTDSEVYKSTKKQPKPHSLPLTAGEKDKRKNPREKLRHDADFAKSPLLIYVETCRTNSSSSAEPRKSDEGLRHLGPPTLRETIPQKSSSASSLDDLSSPMSQVEYDSVQDCSRRLAISSAAVLANWKESDSGSFVSFSESEVPYNVELSMREKRKISEQSVRCLLSTQCNGEPVIFSCSGSCSDPDAVLKWTKRQNEGEMEKWDSKSIVCNETVKPALDPRHGLSHNLGLHSNPPYTSCNPEIGQFSSNSFVHVTSNIVGNSLAKVHDIITNLSSDIPIS